MEPDTQSTGNTHKSTMSGTTTTHTILRQDEAQVRLHLVDALQHHRSDAAGALSLHDARTLAEHRLQKLAAQCVDACVGVAVEIGVLRVAHQLAAYEAEEEQDDERSLVGQRRAFP